MVIFSSDKSISNDIHEYTKRKNHDTGLTYKNFIYNYYMPISPIISPEIWEATIHNFPTNKIQKNTSGTRFNIGLQFIYCTSGPFGILHLLSTKFIDKGINTKSDKPFKYRMYRDIVRSFDKLDYLDTRSELSDELDAINEVKGYNESKLLLLQVSSINFSNCPVSGMPHFYKVYSFLEKEDVDRLFVIFEMKFYSSKYNKYVIRNYSAKFIPGSDQFKDITYLKHYNTVKSYRMYIGDYETKLGFKTCDSDNISDLYDDNYYHKMEDSKAVNPLLLEPDELV